MIQGKDLNGPIPILESFYYSSLPKDYYPTTN